MCYLFRLNQLTCDKLRSFCVVVGFFFIVFCIRDSVMEFGAEKETVVHSEVQESAAEFKAAVLVPGTQRSRS